MPAHMISSSGNKYVATVAKYTYILDETTKCIIDRLILWIMPSVTISFSIIKEWFNIQRFNSSIEASAQRTPFLEILTNFIGGSKIKNL